MNKSCLPIILSAIILKLLTLLMYQKILGSKGGWQEDEK